MSNNAAGLNAYLDTALRETTVDSIWTSAEKDNVIAWSVARLWPHVSKVSDWTSDVITLVADTVVYDAPAGIMSISRLDLWDGTPAAADSSLLYSLNGRAWDVLGDPEAGTLQVYVNPVYVTAGYCLGVVGYKRYDVTTTLIPDYLVPLVLAMARAELYRRLAADREMFTTWLSRNQGQNVSINELLQMINEADNEAKMLWKQVKVWQKPVSGRVG